MVDEKLTSVELSKQIQYINGNPAFTTQEKQVAIAKLKGAASDSTKDSKKKV